MTRFRREEATVTYAPRAGRPGRPDRKPWKVTFYDKDGIRRRKFYATEEHANRFKDELEVQLDEGRERDRRQAAIAAAVDGETFKDFADRWLSKTIVRKAASTRKSYKEMLTNHVYRGLGHLPVPALDVKRIADHFGDLHAAGMSWGTQKVVLGVLSSALDHAVWTKVIAANPCHKMKKKLKPGDAVDPEPNPLTPAQAEAFLHWVLTGQVPGRSTIDGPRGRGGRVLRDRAGFPEWYAYFLTLLRTGMRKGEAAALQWTTVLLDRTPVPQAHLENSYSPAAAAASKTGLDGDVILKGKKKHWIDLAIEVVDALRQLRQGDREAALKAGRPISPYVFLTPRGTRALPDSNTIDRIFERGMKALQLEAEGHTIHDLRDTFATSHLIQNPGKLAWVSWMLGHKHPTTTLTRYTKWVPQHLAGKGATYANDLGSANGGESRTAHGDRE